MYRKSLISATPTLRWGHSLLTRFHVFHCRPVVRLHSSTLFLAVGESKQALAPTGFAEPPKVFAASMTSRHSFEVDRKTVVS